MKVDFHNVRMEVEIMVATEHGKLPKLEAIETELEHACKNGLWVHTAIPKVVHTATENINDDSMHPNSSGFLRSVHRDFRS